MNRQQLIARLGKNRMPMGDTDQATEPVDNPQEEMADMIKMTPQTVGAIRRAPKGKLPPGLEKYLAKKRAAKKGK